LLSQILSEAAHRSLSVQKQLRLLRCEVRKWQILLQKSKSRKSNNPKNRAKVDLWTPLLLYGFPMQLRMSVIDFG
jgi:hypothetical protein